MANLWMSSVSAHPPLLGPTDYGWKISSDRSYEIKWYEIDCCPKSLDVVCEDVEDDCTDENIEGIVQCKK